MLPDIGKISGLKFKPFDPLLAPGNVAIYDGDINCSNANWRDTSGNNQITFFNAPTYNATGLNGHGTVLFDGINQYGESTIPTINQPYTIYLVLRQISFISGDFLLACQSALNRYDLFQTNPSPNIVFNNGIDSISTNQLIINTFNIITLKMVQFPKLWGLRIGLNNMTFADMSDTGGNGLEIAVNRAKTLFGNCEYAYIILRNIEDETWLQNNFINWLKNRFAI